MDLNEVLESLYSKELDSILPILNSSLYITDHEFDDNELVIDTGFTFKLQTGKRFRVLYDIISETVIRQPVIENKPLLNGCGMILIRKGWYYNDTILYFISGINHTNDTLSRTLVDTEKELRAYFDSDSKFEVSKTNTQGESECIAKYPLKCSLDTLLFFDGTDFSKYVSPQEWEYQREDIYDNEYERPRSYEDGLRDEYGDEAGTAYWNHE